MRPRIPALLVAGIATGALFSAGAQAAPAPLVVMGEANPATDPGNVQTLCASCHNRKTAQETARKR